MSTDKTAIEAAVQTYFDGLYEADADKLMALSRQRIAESGEEAARRLASPGRAR